MGRTGSGLWPFPPSSFTPSLSYAFQYQALYSVPENKGHPDFSGGTTGNRKTVLGVSYSCQVCVCGGGGADPSWPRGHGVKQEGALGPKKFCGLQWPACLPSPSPFILTTLPIRCYSPHLPGEDTLRLRAVQSPAKVTEL